MATKRKKATNNKQTNSSKKNTDFEAKQQLTAVILFAVSALLLCLAIIPGGNFWNMVHKFFFGIFGVFFWIVPVVFCVFSVFLSLGRVSGKIKVRFIEVSLLTVMIMASVDTMFGTHANESFWQHLTDAYISGSNFKGSGFLGALLGHPFYCLFGGNPQASIFLCIVTFVVLMLLTGTTLVAFLKMCKKSVDKIETVAESAFAAQKKNINKEKFDIDIPFGEEDPEIIEKNKKGLDEKQKKVITTYNDEEIPMVADLDSQDTINLDENSDFVSKINSSLEKKNNSDNTEVFNIDKEKLDASQFNFEKEQGVYDYPPVSLLNQSKSDISKNITAELEATATKLVDTLRSFGVDTKIINISRGPSVTRYELQPSAGVKISKITNLSDDIALNLATAGVRIEAPIPNKPAVGIEVPNKNVSMVGVREIIDSSSFNTAQSKLSVSLGKDISGNVVVADIAKMPHGLIAGATGSGKSVCINSIIISLLYKATPDEVKLLLIDPKVVELGIYNGIPHLLVPVVTDPRKAAGALGWAVTEMEKRYKMFAETGVRDIKGYNKLAQRDETISKMPQIVIIIDELADLMMTAPGEVEDSICRIAQKARAAGMHLIIATQRPSVDVVTGLIKANIPTRIAFAVSSQIDSRTIIDGSGAEKLMGRGDMLFYPAGSIKPQRIQGCFVSDEEVEAVVDYVKNEHDHTYDEDVINEIERQAAKEKVAKSGLSEDAPSDTDPLLNQAIECVIDAGQASTSLLQRKLKVGYARAARIVDEMEERGIVGPYEGSKPRQIKISRDQWNEMQLSLPDVEN